MNRERRRRFAKILWKFRKKSGKTRAEMAALLNWDISVYVNIELGMVAPSEGQQADVRQALKASIASAAIRDNLRRGARNKLWTRGRV